MGKLLLGKLAVVEVSVGEVRSWGSWVGELGVGEIALETLPNTVYCILSPSVIRRLVFVTRSNGFLVKKES